MVRKESVNEATHPGAAPEDQIGARIAQMRAVKGLNHDGLAKLTKLLDAPSNAGISRTTIRGYEVGLYKPGTRELRLLSEALEVTPTWLIFGDPPEMRKQSQYGEIGPALPPSELQKLIVALHLLRGLEPVDRDTVYAVLHSISRHKHGENEYRAEVLSVNELAGIVGDLWNDAKDGNQPDQAKLQELLTAYGPHIDRLLQQEFGKSLSDFRAKPEPI